MMIPFASQKKCPACSKPRTPLSSSSKLLFIVPGTVTLVLLLLLCTQIHFSSRIHAKLTKVERLLTRVPETKDNRQCPFHIVYNKPHKTASSKIRLDLLEWAASQKRPPYNCLASMKYNLVQFPECIPEDPSGCGIIAMHFVLSPHVRAVLRERLGKYVLVTSTRNGRDRIISRFLQIKLQRAEAIDHEELRSFIRKYNPWTLYNYHTGANMTGTCPLTESEKKVIPNAVNQADVVIDQKYQNESQAILDWKGLFQLSDDMRNVKGTKHLVLDDRTEEMVKNVSCVDEELHRLFQMRMAYLYERATGKRCEWDSRNSRPCWVTG